MTDGLAEALRRHEENLAELQSAIAHGEAVLAANGAPTLRPCIRRFAALGMIADIRRQIEESDGVPVRINLSPMAAEILAAESDALRGRAAGVPVILAVTPEAVLRIEGLDAYLIPDEGAVVVVIFAGVKYTPKHANSNRPMDQEIAMQAESVLGAVRALRATMAEDALP